MKTIVIAEYKWDGVDTKIVFRKITEFLDLWANNSKNYRFLKDFARPILAGTKKVTEKRVVKSFFLGFETGEKEKEVTVYHLYLEFARQLTSEEEVFYKAFVLGTIYKSY